MGALLEPPVAGRYTPIPLDGLAGGEPLEFQVQLRTAPGTWVLYRDVGAVVDDEHLGRLRAEGVTALYVRPAERWAYYRRIENRLSDVLTDRTVPLEQRAEVLHGVATDVAREILRRTPGSADVDRARRLFHATGGLLLREPGSFRAVRQVLTASAGLAQHSLTVSLLCMGLARHAVGADPVHLINAGLAGLLHDVGRVGHEHLGNDQAHAERGARILAELGLPDEVVQAARHHHERFDGSGHPAGLRGDSIPTLARLVMVADTFEKVYSGQQPQVGVFDVLRIMARAWHGCFDPRMVAAFIKLFG